MTDFLVERERDFFFSNCTFSPKLQRYFVLEEEILTWKIN